MKSLFYTIIVILFSSVIIFGQPQVPTYYVDDDFNSSTPGWQITHFDKIQDAIDKGNLCLILVYPGTYYEINDVFIGKDPITQTRQHITLRSTDGPASTNIVGTGTSSVVTFDGAADTCKLIGFTIKNGVGSSAGGWGQCGGGIIIRDCSPLIMNNIITENEADNGGGVFFYHDIDNYTTAPTIDRNVIYNNTATDAGEFSGRGGGICGFVAVDPAIIKNNYIHHNKATHSGGGIKIRQDASTAAIGNIITIESNRIEHNTCFGSGGGISTSEAGQNHILKNKILHNHSPAGSGLHLDWKTYFVDPLDRDLVDSNDIGHNDSYIEELSQAYGDGGGIYINDCNPIIVNNMIFDNRVYDDLSGSYGKGGGIYAGGGHSYTTPISITNNSISDNIAETSGGGMYVDGTYGTHPNIYNTIIWNNSSNNGVNQLIYIHPTPVVMYCDVEDPNNPNNPWPGPNIWVNPSYVNPSGDNYHLVSPGSLCIDVFISGNTAPDIPTFDYDGQNRIINGIVDIGADETL